jgi:hypothetical protein
VAVVTARDERRDTLRRKCLSLGAGELVAAVIFGFVAFASVTPRLRTGDERAALWSALIPLLRILIQGGIYWLLARRWVKLRPCRPGWPASIERSAYSTPSSSWWGWSASSRGRRIVRPSPCCEAVRFT